MKRAKRECAIRGVVLLSTPKDGTGWRARCRAKGCKWTDGWKNHGDYFWLVEGRALHHIVEKHDRRRGGDRRARPTAETLRSS